MKVTLKTLFFGAEDDDGADDVLDGEGGNLDALEDGIKEQLPKVPFKAIRDELRNKILEVLDVGLEAVLGASWTKYQGIQEYADPEEHPPEETALAPLADHTIESSHSPHVDLVIKDAVLATIQLDIELAITLEGVLLKIQGGRILSLEAGSGQVSGSLTCTLNVKDVEKELMSVEKETPRLELPVAVPLGDGIAIPSLK